MPVPNGPHSHGPTRRQFLTRAAILAAAAPTLGAFLAACSKSGPSSGQPTLTLAAPDHPVKWDIADDNKPIADGLAPEKGATLKIYNYADYLSPQAIKSFEDQARHQDRGLHLQRRRRGDHQAAQWSRLRHLQRQLHRDQPPGGWEAGPTAEPLLHPRHQERVAELHQPLVRPGMALHRAVHHLHDRNRLADRPGARRYRRAEESV